MRTDPPKSTRRALLIGIDRYPNFPDHAQLAGCVNDVRAMAELLINRFSFATESVERLVDGAATRAGIRAALASLVEKVGPDDVVVIQYCGHGSRILDLRGDSPDGMDETIVPCDSGRQPAENRDIRDTEIHRWLLRLTERTAYLTLIFDSCHSGHILRDPFGGRGRWVEPDPLPGAKLDATPENLQRSRQIGWAESREVGGYRSALAGKYVLLAGCRSTETAFEILGQETGDGQHGIFTYLLCRELARAGATSTFRDLFELVAPQVSSRYPSQHPQIEGASDRQLFGLSRFEPMQFVPIRPQGGQRGLLEAGAASGITVGSTWLVYPPGTKSLASEVQPLGRAEVTRVNALDSEARLVGCEIEGAGGRAVEQMHRYGEMRFAVEVRAPGASQGAAEELEAAVAGSKLLRLHQGEGAAAARVYLVTARHGVAPEAPVPAVGPLEEDSWAVVGRDGELLMPVHALAEPGVVGLLVENLEKRARFEFAMELFDPGGPLRGSVRLAILGREGERWVERGLGDPGDAGATYQEPVFRAGERIAFRIGHCHSSPLYFYLLDFGLSGAISIIYPDMGGEQKAVSRDGSILVGDEAGDEITLRLPEAYPWRGGPESPAPQATGGMETVKLFATTRPAHFGALLQHGMRSDSSPLGRLLSTSLTGHGRREMEVNRPTALGDWTVVQASFRLLPS